MRHVVQFHGTVGYPVLQLTDDADNKELVIQWAKRD